MLPLTKEELKLTSRWQSMLYLRKKILNKFAQVKNY